MGFTMYVIDTETGEYIHYGKELEVKGEGNHLDTVAMLQFFIDKEELGHSIIVRRFDIHDSDTPLLKKDVSAEYRKYAEEETLEVGVISYDALKGELEQTMFKLEETQHENERLREMMDGRCGNERPNRKTLCQLESGHSGSHSAVVYWEDEKASVGVSAK